MEYDPTGKQAGEAGAKLDAGKARIGLVLSGFSRALAEVSKVGTFGAAKYCDDGWVAVPNGQSRYTDALFRHLLAEGRGEGRDPDSGLLHAAHAAWNALARLDLFLREQESKAACVLSQKDLKAAFAKCPQTPGFGQWVELSDNVKFPDLHDAST